MAKLPKFRPLFSKRFARRKEGEKNPTPGAPQTCPKERAFYAFRFFPLLFFFSNRRFFFPPPSPPSTPSFALGRDEEEGKREKCRARIIEPRQRPIFMEMDGIVARGDRINGRWDSYSYSYRKQSLSGKETESLASFSLWYNCDGFSVGFFFKYRKEFNLVWYLSLILKHTFLNALILGFSIFFNQKSYKMIYCLIVSYGTCYLFLFVYKNVNYYFVFT